MKEKATIIAKHEDFLVYIIPLLSNFPKNHKFLLADRIENHLLDILNLFIEAYYKSRQAKKDYLAKANIEIEKTRHLVRLCYNLKIFTHKQYQHISVRLDEIGRMNGAWYKSLQ